MHAARRSFYFLYLLLLRARWSRLPRPSKIERFSNLSGACTGSSEVASRRIRISTLGISGITTTVRRQEALPRFARYLFVYNLAIFLWVVITKLFQMPSFRCLMLRGFAAPKLS
jgi:hypothetical protein